MILKSGELYFMGEKDLKTGKDSPFVKIGLVRESDSRDSAKRLKDHQTGNPRKLHIVKIVNSPAVEKVETVLHGKYATSRVSGEWFYFDDTPIEDVIKEANSLAKSMKNNIEALEEAEVLKKKKSTSKILDSTSEINKWYNEYIRANFQSKLCADSIKMIQNSLIEASRLKLDIGHIIDIQKRKASMKFDEAGFKEKHPKIWSEFTVTSLDIKQRFNWFKPKGKDFDLQKINLELHDLLAESMSLAKSPITRESAAERLHFNYLRTLTFQAPLGWTTELAEANVKSACGSASGIEDICSWPRTVEEVSKIDKDALKEKHLKKYESFVSQSSGSEAAVLAKDRGFRA